MKPIIKTPGHLILKPLRLFLDDLEKVIQILKAHNFSVKFYDNDYEYESLDEIRKYRGPRIVSLKIDGEGDGYLQKLSINFSKERIILYRHGESDQNILLAWQEIKDFLCKKLHWYQRVFTPWIWGFVFIIALCVCPFCYVLGASARAIVLTMWLLFPAIIVLLLVSHFWCKFFPGLYLDRKFRVLNFWQRNSDKIILVLLGALFGFIGKCIFDLIFNKQ